MNSPNTTKGFRVIPLLLALVLISYSHADSVVEGTTQYSHRDDNLPWWLRDQITNERSPFSAGGGGAQYPQAHSGQDTANYGGLYLTQPNSGGSPLAASNPVNSYNQRVPSGSSWWLTQLSNGESPFSSNRPVNNNGQGVADNERWWLTKLNKGVSPFATNHPASNNQNFANSNNQNVAGNNDQDGYSNGRWWFPQIGKGNGPFAVNHQANNNQNAAGNNNQDDSSSGKWWFSQLSTGNSPFGPNHKASNAQSGHQDNAGQCIITARSLPREEGVTSFGSGNHRRYRPSSRDSVYFKNDDDDTPPKRYNLPPARPVTNSHSASRPDSSPVGSRRGDDHDVRDTSFWMNESQEKSSLKSCSALVEQDNLDNPFLFVHNLVRCREDVSTAVSWDKDLEATSRDVSMGLMEYVFKRIDGDGRYGASGSADNGAGGLKQTSEKVITTDLWKEYLGLLEKSSPGFFWPYAEIHPSVAGSQGVNKFTPISQTTLFYHSPVSDVDNGRGQASTKVNDPVQYDSYAREDGVFNDDPLRSVIHVDAAGESSSNPGIMGRYISKYAEDKIEGSYDGFRLSGTEREEAFRYYTPFLLLNKKYLGAPNKAWDLSDVTMTADEYYAASMYINMYLDQRYNIESTLGKGNTGKGMPYADVVALMNYSGTNLKYSDYFQMIWASSDKVGCSCYAKYGSTLCVCLYSPSGKLGSQVANDPSNLSQMKKKLMFSDKDISDFESLGVGSGNYSVQETIASLLDFKERQVKQ